jgi:hypothetical protein
MNQVAELPIDVRRERLLSSVQSYLAAGYVISRMTDTFAELVLPAAWLPAWLRRPTSPADTRRGPAGAPRMLIEVADHGEVIARGG